MSSITSRARVRIIDIPATTTIVVELAVAGNQLAARLLNACISASRETGFHAVTVDRDGPELFRVVASNPAGQLLVSELAIPVADEPSLTTEVVGIRDGSCEAVLDQFDEALEEQGLRSAPPTRRHTGGVCQLAAARRFAAALLPRSAGSVAPSGARPAARRGSAVARKHGRSV